MELFNQVDVIKDELGKEFPSLNQVSTSTLAGHTSLFIRISLDPRETWINGFFENSRYGLFCISDGKIELIAKGLGTQKLRKGNVKTVEDVMKKLKMWKEKTLSA
jgi:hypothetical protein